MKNIPDSSVLKGLINFIEYEDILEVRIEDQLFFMKRHFSDFEDISRNVIIELDGFVASSPQKVIDLCKDVFLKDERLSTLVAFSRTAKKEDLTPYDKIDLIGTYFELSSLLKLGAFLLSRRNDPIENFKDEHKEKILKYFKQLGINNKDKENIRLIRNSSKHLLKIERDKIVFPNDDSLTIQEINDLYGKVEHVFSWWTTLIMTSIWFNLKFGILAAFSTIYYMKDYKIKLDEYHQSLKLFFPDVIIEKEKKEISPFKKKIRFWKIKLKVRLKRWLGRKDNRDQFYEDNFEEIVTHLARHTDAISNLLNQFSENLENEEDKARMKKIEDWFRKGTPTFKAAIIGFKENGGKLFD